MSLLGVDVGTTGCKAAVFDERGRLLGSAYREYDIRRPQPGWEELDAEEVWGLVKQCIAQAVRAAGPRDPVRALSVSSLGEAMTPVTEDRRILGPSLLNSDARGAEYLDRLHTLAPDDRLYRINGNVVGNHYSLTKLLWLLEHQPDLWRRTWKFLLWSPFIEFMLGAEAVVDYSLANRTLLFDLDREDWSPELLRAFKIEPEKLPRTAPSGTQIGTVAPDIAAELGLPQNVAIVTGAHDQCANAVGCGVIDEHAAMYGMGTYICVVPVVRERRPAEQMIPRGLNTEHHAAPGRFVSFVYNHGGSMVKWFRDTFAAAEKAQAQREGRDVYDALFAELPDAPSPVLVLPHFAPTGPPEFIADSAGVIAGLHLDTTRGDILKGIIEGATYYLRECMDDLPPDFPPPAEYRAVGGGSRSDKWVQASADIFGHPFVRPRVTAEAGALGAAILAGVGAGFFDSIEEGVEAMVALDRRFEPDPRLHATYTERFEQYKRLGPAFREFLRGMTQSNT